MFQFVKNLFSTMRAEGLSEEEMQKLNNKLNNQFMLNLRHYMKEKHNAEITYQEEIDFLTTYIFLYPYCQSYYNLYVDGKLVGHFWFAKWEVVICSLNGSDAETFHIRRSGTYDLSTIARKINGFT